MTNSHFFKMQQLSDISGIIAAKRKSKRKNKILEGYHEDDEINKVGNFFIN